MTRRYPFAESVVRVPVSGAPYDVVAGRRMLPHLGPTLLSMGVSPSLVVVTDRRVAALYLDPLVRHLKRHSFSVLPIVVPPGEAQKSLRTAESIFSTMLRHGAGRQSTLLALGGGVVGDLAGFIAATFQRGISLVHIPTTLLAQVDSSIGGKVAVNLPLGKNMVGAFYQPKLVWADAATLRTLPRREVVCGMGEVIKYGVIRDSRLFGWLETHLESAIRGDLPALQHVQAACCSIKASVCGRDERETGVRVILNYGHTIGHAIEAAGGYEAVKHGEAVLLGMKAEAWIARSAGVMSGTTYERICALIDRVPVRVSTRKIRVSTVVSRMRHDKKNKQGRKRFVLPVRIGSVTVIDDIDEAVVRGAVEMVL